MNGCKSIRRRIDEAEKPNMLPFDVSEHLGRCGECSRFATERSALRELVAGGTRVGAPINFDAVLKARLAEVSSRRSFWWLGSPGLLRLGAATAGVVVMLFAAQYAGWFAKKPVVPSSGPVAGNLTAPAPTPSPETFVAPAPAAPVIAAGGERPNHPYIKSSKLRRAEVRADGAAPVGFMTADDGGVVLVRGRNGDIDMQMPTVSVGAQSLLYVSAGQRRATRTVGTSF